VEIFIPQEGSKTLKEVTPEVFCFPILGGIHNAAGSSHANPTQDWC